MSQLTLLGGPDSRVEEFPVYPDWYTPTKTRRTANTNVLRGVHPFGRPLGPEGSTCGTCEHAERQHHHDAVFRKCGKHPVTRGPATDLVFGWRCCDLYEPRKMEETP